MALHFNRDRVYNYTMFIQIVMTTIFNFLKSNNIKIGSKGI